MLLQLPFDHLYHCLTFLSISDIVRLLRVSNILSSRLERIPVHQTAPEWPTVESLSERPLRILGKLIPTIRQSLFFPFGQFPFPSFFSPVPGETVIFDLGQEDFYSWRQKVDLSIFQFPHNTRVILKNVLVQVPHPRHTFGEFQTTVEQALSQPLLPTEVTKVLVEITWLSFQHWDQPPTSIRIRQVEFFVAVGQLISSWFPSKDVCLRRCFGSPFANPRNVPKMTWSHRLIEMKVFQTFTWLTFPPFCRHLRRVTVTNVTFRGQLESDLFPHLTFLRVERSCIQLGPGFERNHLDIEFDQWSLFAFPIRCRSLTIRYPDLFGSFGPIVEVETDIFISKSCLFGPLDDRLKIRRRLRLEEMCIFSAELAAWMSRVPQVEWVFCQLDVSVRQLSWLCPTNRLRRLCIDLRQINQLSDDLFRCLRDLKGVDIIVTVAEAEEHWWTTLQQTVPDCRLHRLVAR